LYPAGVICEIMNEDGTMARLPELKDFASAHGLKMIRVADLVRDVLKTAMDGVTELIARAPETQNATHGLSPTELAELIFAVARGMLMFDVLRPQQMTAAERRERQLEVTRTLWRLLFKPEAELAYA